MTALILAVAASNRIGKPLRRLNFMRVWKVMRLHFGKAWQLYKRKGLGTRVAIVMLTSWRRGHEA